MIIIRHPSIERANNRQLIEHVTATEQLDDNSKDPGQTNANKVSISNTNMVREKETINM